MKRILRQGIKWGLPLLLIVLVLLFRLEPAWAEGYSRTCYPWISDFLSSVSSLVPFSLGDCFIVLACLWGIGYPFYAWRKKMGGWYTVSKIFRFLVWIYIWFNLAWGINYFRLPFYERTGLEKTGYEAEEFKAFLDDYVVSLDSSFQKATVSRDKNWYLQPWHKSEGGLPVCREINQGYRRIASQYGIQVSDRDLLPKYMLWSKGMSKMGISGYMGPFFSEFHLNREILNVEYPFTYAHELAHRLGIAGEAEANLYAALVTTGSGVAEIRFSGYFSLLGYVMNNARRLLTPDEYAELCKKIPPDIIELYREHLMYWRGKYNPSAGKIQNKVYNAYLKGNKVENGTKNYSEVVGLFMAILKSNRP